MLSKILEHKTYLFIFIIWLFHVSAIIGMSIGYFEWFLPKTPLNILLSFSLLLLLLRPDNRTFGAILVFFIAGILVEWVGVKTGFLFGAYEYGNNLGVKVDGVPLLIGVNWAMLILITGTLASATTKSFIGRVIIGSLLMVVLDFFIEPLAPTFDFWYWEQEKAPLQNFAAWFVVSAILHVIFQKAVKQKNFQYSLHLYLAQLIFFAFFYAH